MSKLEEKEWKKLEKYFSVKKNTYSENWWKKQNTLIRLYKQRSCTELVCTHIEIMIVQRTHAATSYWHIFITAL